MSRPDAAGSLWCREKTCLNPTEQRPRAALEPQTLDASRGENALKPEELGDATPPSLPPACRRVWKTVKNVREVMRSGTALLWTNGNQNSASPSYKNSIVTPRWRRALVSETFLRGAETSVNERVAPRRM